MIRKISGKLNNIGDYEIFCDSCYIKMAKCINFEFIKGQELIYSPILCEKCGTEHSKFVGELVKGNEEMDK